MELIHLYVYLAILIVPPGEMSPLDPKYSGSNDSHIECISYACMVTFPIIVTLSLWPIYLLSLYTKYIMVDFLVKP